jgi:hypothetical protein
MVVAVDAIAWLSSEKDELAECITEDTLEPAEELDRCFGGGGRR